MPFLKPDRTPTIHHPQGHPVAVIAAFNVLGELIPRYFCIEDDYQELFKYKVSSIRTTKDRHMVKEFYCTYDSNGYRNDLVLIFDIMRCQWKMG